MIELTENMLRLQYDSFKKYVNFIEKELETLRARLVKAEKVIDIVHGMQAGQQLDGELFVALKEYRGEGT